jgi:3-hydroxyisobutyrate dehydrogenase-like beta-hydroxyacid dehydrogenase
MSTTVSLIGFGEAAQAFVGDARWTASARAFDKLTDRPETREAKFSQYKALGIAGADSASEAVSEAENVISLVTADQSLDAAQSATLRSGTFYFDMNSVAPTSKREAAEVIEGRGGNYVDVAIMAPVHPDRLIAPLLLSGPSADTGADRLRKVGFANVRIVGRRVGQAAAIKMIRSVIVKGMEALTAEAALAASAAGVLDEVIASLDASDRSLSWAERIDYNLARMMVHGGRRAEEMSEVVRTLETLGVEPLLTRGTVKRQRQIGGRQIAPAEGLATKLEQLRPRQANAA